MRNTERENIKEHSLDVAILAHGLASIHNAYFGGNVDTEHVIALAVYHEAGEVITGDLPTPIKYYNPEIREAYGKIEELAVRRMLQMLPEKLRPDYAPLLEHDGAEAYCFVKYADKLAAYIKCVQELRSGNQEFEKAKATIEREIGEIQEPAVRYFMEHCLPGYGLTLDELN